MPPLSDELKRHRLWALGTIIAAYILSFFQRFAPASIAEDLAVSFQTSATSLGVLAATYFYVYTLMQIPTGILADTLGPRRILLAGGLIGSIGSITFGLAPSIETALIGRILVGLGVSVTFIAMLKIIALWFEENRFASITGIAILLGNLGSVLAGAPLAFMAENTGWRSTFIAVGVVSLLLGIACWLLVRDHPPGYLEKKGTQRFDRTVIFGNLLTILRNRATWPAIWSNFGISGAFFAFGGLWATPYLVQVHHFTRSEAANHLSLLFFGFAIGSLIIGNLSDRVGRRRPVFIFASFLNALIWLIWTSALPLPAGSTYALIFVMGLCTASFTLSWACSKEVNPPLLSGMSTAVSNMGGFLAGALLQPLVGAVIDVFWDGQLLNGARVYEPADFRAGLSLMCLSAWIGFWGALRIRETYCRNIWAQ